MMLDNADRTGRTGRRTRCRSTFSSFIDRYECVRGNSGREIYDGSLRVHGHTATLIDPMVDRLPLLDRMFKEYLPGQAPQVLERLAGLIKVADDLSSFLVNTITASACPFEHAGHFLEEYFWRPSAMLLFGGCLRRRESGDAVAGHAM